MKTHYMLYVLLSCLGLSNAISQTQIGQTLTEFEDGDGFGSSIALNANGTRLLTSAPSFNTNGIDRAGRVDVYEFNGSAWVQLGQTIEGGTSIAFGQFGRGLDMSVSGNRIALGNLDSKSQAYQWNESTQLWEQMGSDLEFPGQPNAHLRSFRFSEDENTLIVGGFNAGQDSVYVFEWDGNNWNIIGNPLQLPARNELAISNDALTVASLFFDSSSGDEGIKIYTFNGTDWDLNFTRTVDADLYISSGFDLSGNGDRLVLMSVDVDVDEIATIETYDLVGGNWEASLTNTTMPMETDIGSLRMSDDGSVIIIGTGIENPPGAFEEGARVYQVVGNTWQLVNYFEYDNYDETISGNVSITSDGTKVAFGQSIPFAEGFVEVYDMEDLLAAPTNKDLQIQLYPNPTAGLVNVIFSSASEIEDIIVSDMSGRILQQPEFNYNSQQQFHVEGPAGIYFLSVTANRIKQTFRIIKK